MASKHEAAGFAAWRARRDELAANHARAANQWRAIPGNGAGPMGLTPDSVKQSPEWQSAYAAYWRAHNALAGHNAAGVKLYRRELAQEQRERRAARLASAA
jgi:hypothetical protein